MSVPAVFSISDLTVFERHGATVTGRDGRAGCWIKLPNGWTLSVQWSSGNYGSNYDWPFERRGEDDPDATTAEIAAWKGKSGLVEWVDGDTVQGWCPMERVLRVLDLLAMDALMRPDGSRTVADDGWRESA